MSDYVHTAGLPAQIWICVDTHRCVWLKLTPKHSAATLHFHFILYYEALCEVWFDISAIG